MADMDLDEARTFDDIPLFLDAVDASGGSPVAALTEILSVLEVPEPATVHFLALIAISAGIWHRQPFRLRSPASTWG
jgi:hypothetical protein